MSRRRGGLAVCAVLVSVGGMLAVVGGPAGAGTGADPQVRVAGPAPVLPNGAVVTGPSDGAASVTADLALKPRDQSALDAFVAAVSTPGSPQYHQYLKAGQFGSVFGPDASTIASARTWLASNGLQVGPTTPDGLLIPATGSVSQMEQAFSVAVVDTRLPSGRVSRYVSSAPAVPASLAPSVQGVIGLSSAAEPSPQIVHGPSPAGTGGGALPAAPSGGGSAATAPAPRTATPLPHVGPGDCAAADTIAARNGAFTANQLASIYGLSSLYGRNQSGAGVTVGVYELEPFTPGDIANYTACYQVTNTPTPVKVDGGSTSAQSGEAALDVEDVAGLAPGANIKVFVGPQSGNGPIDTYEAMVADPSVNIISTSWGVCEPLMATSPGQQATESTIFAEAAAQGQTVVAAAGDSGSTDCYFPPSDTSTAVTVDDPADQPDVTGVGGTSLTGAGPAETAWNDVYGSGGGGVSSDFARPAWQNGPGVAAPAALAQCQAIGRTSCREVPDVSASSDPAHGYPVYFSGSWEIVGGTSAASPLWAAMSAVVDQGLGGPPGLVNPTLYGAGTCASSPFHDVTAGNNALLSSSGGRFGATANYDLATGWGSADAGRLETALATHPSCPMVTSVLPTKGPTAGGGTVTILGSNFSGATAVDFGGASAPRFSVDSPTSITATVPPGPAAGATVDVSVQGPGGFGRPVPGDQYTYTQGGYWLVAADGGIFSFGNARFFGSMGGAPLVAPVTAMTATHSGDGYWLVAADGGIFSFGDAGFFGSMGGKDLNDPVVAMVASGDDQGYLMVGTDGGVFGFGDAPNFGTLGAGYGGNPDDVPPIAGMALTPGGQGYWMLEPDGWSYSFANPPSPGPSATAGTITAVADSQVNSDPERGDFCNPYGPCEEWCGLFASWVWQQAGIPIPPEPFTGGIFAWAAANTGVLPPTAAPVPGDAVLYGTGPASTATSLHVGLVMQTWPDGAIVTIEGDAGPAPTGSLAVVINGPYLPAQSLASNGMPIYAFAQY